MNANARSFMPRQLPDLPLVFPDQETISKKASELQIDWNPTLDYVKGLSDTRLQKLFKALYVGPRKTFYEYYHEKSFLNFVEWKKECYIRPSLKVMPSTPAYQFLVKVWAEEKHPLGLVHPMALNEGEIIQPITKKYLRELFNSETEMCCQPYVVAAGLLGMKV